MSGLVPCGICERKFAEDRLAKHTAICEKNAKKQPRKAFNVQKQRVQGTDINYNELKRSEKKAPSIKEIRVANRKNNWREKHNDLVSNIRAARGEDPLPPADPYGKGGYDGYSYGASQARQERYEQTSRQQPAQRASNNSRYQPKQKVYEEDSYGNGYSSSQSAFASGRPGPKAGQIQCPTCHRNFAEESGERHMPFCAEQAKKKAIRDNNKSVATAKQAARTSYKPPMPKSTSHSSPNIKMARSSGYGPSGGYSVTQKTSDPSRFGYGTSKYDQFLEDSVANQRVPSAGRRSKSSKASVLAASNKKASTPPRSRLAKVLPSSCRNCSTSYPVEWAKFCCECGTRRI